MAPLLVSLALIFLDHKFLVLILNYSFVNPLGNHLDVHPDAFFKQVIVDLNNLLRSCAIYHLENHRNQLPSFLPLSLLDELYDTLH